MFTPHDDGDGIAARDHAAVARRILHQNLARHGHEQAPATRRGALHQHGIAGTAKPAQRNLLATCLAITAAPCSQLTTSQRTNYISPDPETS